MLNVDAVKLTKLTKKHSYCCRRISCRKRDNYTQFVDKRRVKMKLYFIATKACQMFMLL